jgi:hypothetical protein
MRQEDAVGAAVRDPEPGPDAFEKARPAIVAALDIFVRRSMSAPFSQAPGSASMIRLIACMQKASV